MKVLVTGGRDFRNRACVAREMDALFKEHGHSLMIIEGGARGLDSLVADWCDGNGLPHAQVKALWTVQQLRAGPIRNAAMLLLEPELVVAFPGGDGTANMVELARQCGIRVQVVQDA